MSLGRQPRTLADSIKQREGLAKPEVPQHENQAPCGIGVCDLKPTNCDFQDYCRITAAETPAERPCYQVPSLQGLSPFQTHLSTAESLEESTFQPSLVMQTAFSDGTEGVSNSGLQHLFDAEVPVMEMDARKGSPCQQAAEEFMDPGGLDLPPGRAGSLGSLGLGSAFSQNLAETFMPPGPAHAQQAQPQLSDNPEAERRQGDSEAGKAGQTDWFQTMMQQAHSVGLWGGEAGDKQAPPILPEPLLLKAMSGVEEKLADANPLAVYEMGMASMLRPSRQAWEGPPHQEPPRQQDAPRLQPVSLGMPQPNIQAAFSGGRLQEELPYWKNDGPFRPPTVPRAAQPPGGADGGSGSEMSHPMLQQSKLQLSLGLAADKPLDLKAWGYGGPAGRGQDAAISTSGREGRQPESLGGGQLPSAGGPQPTLSDSSIHPGSLAASDRHVAAFRRSNGMSTSAPAFPFKEGQSMSADHRSTSMSAGPDDSSSRVESLERYREKRRRRLFSKTIRYHKRKVNADKRPRIKGRFVKAAETEGSAPMDDDAHISDGHNEILSHPKSPEMPA